MKLEMLKMMQQWLEFGNMFENVPRQCGKCIIAAYERCKHFYTTW